MPDPKGNVSAMENGRRRNTWDVIAGLIESGKTLELERYLESLKPAETARAVARLDDEKRQQLFKALSPGEAAAVILDLPDAQAAGVIEDLEPDHAAHIVAMMPDDERADVLGDVPGNTASAILNRMSPQEAIDARQLMAYPDNTAGGLMTRDYLAYEGDWTAATVVDDLRRNRERYAGYNVQYVYALTADGKLSGILRLRDLLLAPLDRRISELMIRDIVAVPAGDSLETLSAIFHEHNYIGLPVIDRGNRLLGVVLRDSVLKAAGKRDQHTFLKMSGIMDGEELRSMPFRRRVRRRLAWLSLNILLNILAASVIAFYQETISSAVVLAVFLPIISDMSGCSGNQAVAVSIRELSLGLIRPFEIGRVLLKELVTGSVNGLILGGLITLVALLWKGNPYLGLVVGASLALNTVLSACLGGVLPLVLRRLKIDPALAAGPILTTFTDMFGFFFVLSFATLLLSRLAS